MDEGVRVEGQRMQRQPDSVWTSALESRPARFLCPGGARALALDLFGE